jgi:hypothetical protein
MKIKFLLIFFCIINSCISQNNENTTELYKDMMTFPKELIDHFPITNKNDLTYHIKYFNLGKKNTSNLFVTYKLDENIDLLRDSLISKSKYYGYLNDSCILITKELPPYDGEFLYVFNSCSDSSLYIPIPFDENINQQFGNYEYFVFSLTNENLLGNDNPTHDFPFKYQNGCSKGVLINRNLNVIIYWLGIW